VPVVTTPTARRSRSGSRGRGTDAWCQTAYAGETRHTPDVHVIADVCVVPIGVGVSVSAHVAECERVFAEAGLDHHLHAYGTNVEGEWDEVMAAVKRCHVVHSMGAQRISSTMRFGTRTDRSQTMTEKVVSVEDKLT